MVKFLEFKGEKLPVRVSYKALKELCEVKKTSLTKLDTDNFEIQEYLLYVGLKYGFKNEGQEMKFQLSDMENILDECFMDFMKMIPEFFGKGEEKETKN